MKAVCFKDLSAQGPVEVCKDLCNRLMAHQAERGHTRTDILARMCFETRLKPSFEGNPDRFLLVAYDGDIPIGYVFANSEVLTEEVLSARPEWAAEFPEKSGELYPQNLPVPCRIADLNNLYVLPEYRGEHVGQELMDQAMKWMRSLPDVKYLFTHVSNGNDPGPFYEKQGFHFSHKVWDGFLDAYILEVKCQNWQ